MKKLKIINSTIIKSSIINNSYENLDKINKKTNQNSYFFKKSVVK